MNYIADAMHTIAVEAERQGFEVRQTGRGAWHFRKGSANFYFCPRNVLDVADALFVLMEDAGLHWAPLR